MLESAMISRFVFAVRDLIEESTRDLFDPDDVIYDLL